MRSPADGSERRDGPFLTRSEALLAAIVNSASDGIIAIDPSGIVLSWNTAAADLLGHSAADMIGRSIARITPPDQRPEQDAHVRRVMNGRPSVTFQGRRVTAEGLELPLTITISPVCDWGGHVVAASLFLRRRSQLWWSWSAQRLTAEAEINGGGTTVGEAYLTRADTPARNILVVEDEPLIGLGLAATLENAGFDVIGPALNVREAGDLLDHNDCALAILDVNLGHGETSAPLAERLKDMGIPFLVTSAYRPEDRPEIFNDAPSFAKPVGARTIVAAVQAALA